MTQPQQTRQSDGMVWPMVVVTIAILVAVVTLAMMDKDVTVIATTLLAVVPTFGAILYQRLGQVREQTNGTLSRLLDRQDQMQTQLTTIAAATSPTMLPQLLPVIDGSGATSPAPEPSPADVASATGGVHP